jgi:hypothetical protein
MSEELTHTPIDFITEEQRSNLEKLAKFLETIPPPTFHMGSYAAILSEDVMEEVKELFNSENEDDQDNLQDLIHDFEVLSPNTLLREQPIPDCGTVCCAIGTAPYAGITVFEDEYWSEYAARVFGINTHNWLSIEYALYIWLFDYEWYKVDNTAQGASKRIIYTLKHGIPSNYLEQKEGTEELCY